MANKPIDEQGTIGSVIGQRVKLLRERAELSAREISERIGAGNSLVTQLELGTNENPTIDTVMKLAQVLGTTVRFLTHGEGRMPSAERIRSAFAAFESSK
jgi:transcriptional regulator with XRE-family HTH domain